MQRWKNHNNDSRDDGAYHSNDRRDKKCKVVCCRLHHCTRPLSAPLAIICIFFVYGPTIIMLLLQLHSWYLNVNPPLHGLGSGGNTVYGRYNPTYNIFSISEGIMMIVTVRLFPILYSYLSEQYIQLLLLSTCIIRDFWVYIFIYLYIYAKSS